MLTWLGARAELVRRWLGTFGPGTETDIVWWLVATKAAVRRALATLGAVEASLDDGQTGWLLPDDLEPEPDVEPWAALLPVLDPGRPTYLFDTAGNDGTTAQVVGSDARARLDVEAERLTRWLDGKQISSVYKSRLMKGERLP